MASKLRKRVFPKPPQRLNSITALALGKNSHKFPEAYAAALYCQPDKKASKPKLTELQERMIARIKKHRANAGQCGKQKQD